MVKKLITIDVEDKELKKTAKSVSAKKTKTAIIPIPLILRMNRIIGTIPITLL